MAKSVSGFIPYALLMGVDTTIQPCILFVLLGYACRTGLVFRMFRLGEGGECASDVQNQVIWTRSSHTSMVVWMWSVG